MNHPVMQTASGTQLRVKTPLSHIVVRNTLYNLLTQGLLVIVALGSLPLVVKGLSSDGFGLLSLVWAFIGYFTLLDFGISRANTKFLSEALATGKSDEVQKIVWTSLSVSFLLGLVSGSAIVLATPFLVNDLFKISLALSGDAERAFVIAGLGVPFMLIFGTLKGFQMALQRFEIINIFQGLTGVFQWVGSVALLWWGYGLLEVVLLTVGLRVVLSFVAFAIMPRLIPGVFTTLPLWDRSTLRKFLSFGSWVTVSQVISPLFLYLDRVFIGMFLSLAAVAYYSVPQEALTRVLVVPMSLTTTLFPAMSEQSALSREENKTGVFYYRSLKYLTIVMLPLVLGFFLFAQEIVTLWLGKEFASQSVAIFQILTIGLFFNSLAQIPGTVLHAIGRPDITAKFHLFELPLMIVLNLILIPWIGIAGAAIAWSLRVTIDAMLLFLAARRQIGQLRNDVPGTHLWRKFSLKPALMVVSVAVIFLISDSTAKLVAAVVFATVYAATTWFHSFDDVDRNFFLQLRTRMFG